MADVRGTTLGQQPFGSSSAGIRVDNPPEDLSRDKKTTDD